MYGSIFGGSGGTSEISHNIITNVEPGDFGLNIQRSNIIVAYNQIIGAQEGIGIFTMYGAAGTTKITPQFLNNTIKGWENGIYCKNDVAPKISYNIISENDIGVYCRGVVPEKPLPIVNYNNIFGNTVYGLQNDYPTAGTPVEEKIDAKNNWWGSASGPSGDPGTGYSGQGDKVSKGVNADNWLTEKIGALPPTADFSYTVTTDLGNQTIQFTDNSGDDVSIVSWYWDLGDGNTSTAQSPKHTYLLGNRNYTVTLTVKDNDNNSDIISEQIFVALGGTDLDNDSIPNELDSDRDGDGVLNNADAYPDDPLKYKEEAVKAEKPLNLVPIVVAIIIAVLILVVIAITVSLRKKRK